ncbi:MAG TPA: hypothetical protein PKE12_06750 [Kiritimatiellia bacterium]|nr:hypothetical protein [Kiritimatiellia bacterium]
MHNPNPEPTRNPSGPDFSDRDIPVGKIMLFGFYIAIFTLVSFVGMRLLFKALNREAERADQAVSAFVREARVLPPEPRLQVDEPATWAVERARQRELVSHYAWVDQNSGRVRIPVERAMELLAERGLPARKETPSP